jgi:hypothetical protein
LDPSVLRVLLEIKDPKAPKEIKDSQVHLVRDPKVLKALKVTKEPKVTRAIKEPRVIKV